MPAWVVTHRSHRDIAPALAAFAFLALACLLASVPARAHAQSELPEEGATDSAPAVREGEESAFAGDAPASAAALLSDRELLERASLDPAVAGRLDPALRDGLAEDDVEGTVDLNDEQREAIRQAIEDANREIEDGVSTSSLPVGEAKSAVTPQAISLPSAEGSVEGMGESFSPNLSSGTGTFSVPIALPAGRAGVQPSLGLSYSTSGGNSCVGFGWGLGAPFINRQADRGMPRYVRSADGKWHPEEDTFFYNGGQELVAVDNAAIALVDSSGGDYAVAQLQLLPEGVTDAWQQYRARLEGGFLRFFRSPAGDRWVVQGKDGTRFDFGQLSEGDGPMDLDSSAAVISELPGGGGRVNGWKLTRMSDPHGSTVYYEYTVDEGEHYLANVYYLSPASCAAGSPSATRGCSALLSDYGVRVGLTYETRPDVFTRYTAGWGMTTAWRLRRLTVTAAADTAGERFLVRRYHLTYQPSSESYHSLLASVQVEGRPDDVEGGDFFAHDVFEQRGESTLSDAIVGRTLPPMVFGYSSMPSGGIAGFGSIDNTVRRVAAPPNVSVSAADADLMDVNSDGLPDLIVTDPARYRTPSGEPAAGVFFNGFSGSGTEPAAAGTFSSPVPVAMPSGRSGSLALSNQALVPMDVDGDGRGDLLHMPRLDRYGWFTPLRMSDAAAGGSVRPAEQGWRFGYAEVDLPGFGADPRVDFVRDGARYKTFDVNGDHLIDIVRTSGTVMQTWLNLGSVSAEGEGRFGQARYDAASGAWALSTEPLETCLLQDGLPLDFADSEVRLADMNGDGLQDIVKIRRGRVVYWPGRGLTEDGAPVFGLGPRDCARGEGAGREVRMASPPATLSVAMDNVFLTDVNMDGATDVVQVRTRDVDVWFNRGGESFTDRVTVRSPIAPSFMPRIRFTDIDGSATTDLLYGSASAWEYLDLAGGQRPRLLVQVDNGLGATTTLSYDSSVTDYLADLDCADDLAACGDSDAFTWSQVGDECDDVFSTVTFSGTTSMPDERSGACAHRSGGSPVISTVVRGVSTTDNFHEVGREENVTETRFAYHDGYYEGIEQEFRGFGAADAESVGDVTTPHPTGLTRTFFHQGRRPSDIAGDRHAQNDYEILKGRQWLTEVLSGDGTYLSSAHATIAIRRLATGLDGTHIDYAYVSQTDELRYTTYGQMAGGSEPLPLDSVTFESVSPDNGAVSASTLRRTRMLTPRVPANQWARIQSTTDEVDNLGQVLQATAVGRVADPSFPPGTAFAEAITSHTVPKLVSGARWIWRTERSWVTGDGTTHPLGLTINEYDDATGDLVKTTQEATSNTLPPGHGSWDFSGDGSAVGYAITTAYPSGKQSLLASTSYDAWGNALASCGGADLGTGAPGDCLRYGEVTYDAGYSQLPLSERIAIGPNGVECPSGTSAGGGAFCALATTATWDRGFGVLLSATDPNGQVTTVAYDGLGRMTASVAPNVTGPSQASGECGTSAMQPTTVMRYELVPDGEPFSYVETFADFEGCNGTHLGRSRSYVDGLGRGRATVTWREVNQWWEQSGVAVFTKRGAVFRAYQNAFINKSAPTHFDALALPAASTKAWPTDQAYDAFSRPVKTTHADTTFSELRYYALGTQAWDPLDLGQDANVTTTLKSRSGSARYEDTPTWTRVDGHGRTVEQRLHQRRDGGAGDIDEFHRLLTRYRPDGAVLEVVRALSNAGMTPSEGSVPNPDPIDLPPGGAAFAGAGVDTFLSRQFFYDSVGRRISATDPDSDKREAGGAFVHWRYLFNRVGDLVAVRDPRGCGQNFFYDVAGRLVGEDYVECGSGQFQSSGQMPHGDSALPSGAIGLTDMVTTTDVDARYFFDKRPTLGTLSAALTATSFDLGRLTGSMDRGQRSIVAYDERGRAFESARQMALLPELGPAVEALSAAIPALDAGDAPPSGAVAYDDASGHTYVSRSRYDRLDRPRFLELPDDPAFDGMTPPHIEGELRYGRDGLPLQAELEVSGSVSMSEILWRQGYDRSRLPSTRYVGGTSGGSSAGRLTTTFDRRLQPRTIGFNRLRRPDGAVFGELDYVQTPLNHVYYWDAAGNLVDARNNSHLRRFTTELPDRVAPRRMRIKHDALYRVSQVNFDYRFGTTDDGSGSVSNQTWRTGAPATNWRDEQYGAMGMPGRVEEDPMLREPAEMLPTEAPERVTNLTYAYDWLANMTEWTDDARMFYERSIGHITNGSDLNLAAGTLGPKNAGGAYRPAALYFSAQLDSGIPTARGGYVHLTYGDSGNVQTMTVHARCADDPDGPDDDLSPGTCTDPGGDLADRIDHLADYCTCAKEQHYQYRWDELNRLHEARRYDRAGSGNWDLAVRQRYRYDAGNVRTVKETVRDPRGPGST
ncbi:MAG: SpvB/TcaC N-terminal domain-containing protein, partial [Myxococcota bacterium]